jgi:uncharacterized protein YlzI (FlbEa/FlbD family)
MDTFIKVTSLQGARHAYYRAARIEAIQGTPEGTRLWFDGSNDTHTDVRESVAEVLDQIRGRVCRLPSEVPGDSSDLLEAVRKLADYPPPGLGPPRAANDADYELGRTVERQLFIELRADIVARRDNINAWGVLSMLEKVLNQSLDRAKKACEVKA